MNIGDMIERETKRVDYLLEYTEHIEKTYFNKAELSDLSERQIQERYTLAKETLLKEMANVQNMTKIKIATPPELSEDPLVTVISSFTQDEKEKLREAIFKIKKESSGKQ